MNAETLRNEIAGVRKALSLALHFAPDATHLTNLVAELERLEQDGAVIAGLVALVASGQIAPAFARLKDAIAAGVDIAAVLQQALPTS